MRFLLTAAPLFSLLLATVVAADDVVEDKCTGVATRLAAFPDKTCQCQTNTFIKSDGGKACADGLPANAVATCINIGSTKSKCGYRCSEGYTDDPKARTCTKSDKPEPPKSEPTDVVACPEPMVVSYSSPSGPCGCVGSVNMAKKRKPDAVICPIPANGKPACKNVGTASKCTVVCDKDYKPSEDEKSCVPARKNETKSEMECGADAGSVGFLSADPVKGCVCETTLNPATFCGVYTGELDAEVMCSDKTNAAGTREVTCGIKCPEGFAASKSEKNVCETVEVEGENATMAGTKTPRDSSEAACADKVFKLPGKGGCKCAAEKPAGATECPGVGPKEYGLCQYKKGSGKPARCSTSCVQGAYKDPETNLCD